MNPVVSSQWLFQQLDNPKITVIDCRFSLADAHLGRRQYEENHIPNAYYLDLNKDLSAPLSQHGGRHPLPPWDILAVTLSNLGIHSGGKITEEKMPGEKMPGGTMPEETEETMVIAYDDSSNAFAARLWWLLRYGGHEKVAVLDGGWQEWLSQGYPVTSTVPPKRSGHFIPNVQTDWVIDHQRLKHLKDLPQVALIDSRDGDRYRGEREPIDPVAGHIPGALNFPWKEVCTENGYLRPPEEQQQRWYPLKNYEEMIFYCGSGVTACVNLLSLAMAGIAGGKLYPGGWSDWCSYHYPPRS